MYLDQYDDINEELMEKVAGLGLVLNKREDVSSLPDKDFALIVVTKKRPQRKFPICDKESALLSLLYFLENRKNMPMAYIKTAGAMLKEACVKYDIDVPTPMDSYPIGAESNKVTGEVMEKVAQEVASDEIENIPDEKFGLIKEGQRKFPLIDIDHTKRAIDAFPMVEDRLEPDEAASLRTKIAKAADEFGLSFGEEKIASVNPYLMRDMKFRVRNLEKTAQAPYIKLAKMVEGEQITIKEASAVLDRLDKDHNLHRTMTAEEVLIGQKVNSLEKNAFVDEFLEKVASSRDTASKLQYVFQDEDKKGELIEKLKENFDVSLVDGLVADTKDVLDSLPDPHKDMIDNIVEEMV